MEREQSLQLHSLFSVAHSLSLPLDKRTPNNLLDHQVQKETHHGDCQEFRIVFLLLRRQKIQLGVTCR